MTSSRHLAAPISSPYKMKLTKSYLRTTFSPAAIHSALVKHFGTDDLDTNFRGILIVSLPDGGKWDHDRYSDWVADYRVSSKATLIRRLATDGEEEVQVSMYGNHTEVTVSSRDRSKILATFHVFDDAFPGSQRPLPPPTPQPKPRVFIGHGRSTQWRDLKDHLQDKHGIEVIAYETGSRSGHTIRDVLESMLDSSSLAFLLMTAEDETADGTRRARQNVVHEVGLFQGRLGFAQAIVLLEDGCEEFSNISGIDQIRYGANRIAETYGHVLAAIKREHD